MLFLTIALFGGMGVVCAQPTSQAGAIVREFAPAHSSAESAELPGGEIPWFKGSYEALMANAKLEGKLVFLNFWTEW